MRARSVRRWSALAVSALTTGLLAVAAPPSLAATPSPVADSSYSARFLYPTSAGPITRAERATGSVTVLASGVRIMSSSFGTLLVRPAQGVFAPGTTTLAPRININEFPLIDPAQGELGYGAFSLCQDGVDGASLTVDDATYAAGALQSLAASVAITCAGDWPPVDLDLRVRSTSPTRAAAVNFLSYNQTTPPPAGTARTVSIPVTNRSSVPLTLGDPVVGDVPAGWTVEVTRGTCPAVLAVSTQCSLSAHTVSGGTAASVQVSIPTPDDPDLDLRTVVTTAFTMGAPKVTARSAYDGVGLRVRWSPLIPRPTGLLVQRSTDGGSTWTDLGDAYPSSYVDTGIAAGTTAKYRVLAQYTGANPTASELVSATRTTDVPVIDPAIDTTVAGTTWPAAGGGFSISGLVSSLPDGPGVYDIPGDVRFSTTCATQDGTLTVRELVHHADGSAALADADLVFTCGDNPTQISRWLKGVDSLQQPLLGMTTSDQYWYPFSGTQIDPVPLKVTVTNVGTVPWPKSFTTSSTAPAGTFGLSSNCPAVLAVGAACTVTMTARAKDDWAGKASLVARGAGIGGADVKAEYDLSLRYDDTAPRRIPVPVDRFVDERHWGFGPDEYDDSETGLDTFDVRVKVSVDGRFTSWRYPSDAQRRSLQTDGSWVWNAVPGQDACLSSRARDRAGNVTGWSPAKCSLRLLDDSEGSNWTHGWTQKIGNDAFWVFGGFLHTTKPGSTFSSYNPVAGRTVALEVKTCPTCGNVNVYIGSTRVGTLSTYSAKDAWHVIRSVTYPSTLRGTLRVVSTSTKPVFLDGWGVSVR